MNKNKTRKLESTNINNRDSTFSVFCNNWMKQPESMKIKQITIGKTESAGKIMAEVHFANGKMQTFNWGNYNERVSILSKICSDTVIIDKRAS